MSLRFSASARSEVGLVRQKNEDSAVINGVFIAVADGMGGHVGGDDVAGAGENAHSIRTPGVTRSILADRTGHGEGLFPCPALRSRERVNGRGRCADRGRRRADRAQHHGGADDDGQGDRGQSGADAVGGGHGCISSI